LPLFSIFSRPVEIRILGHYDFFTDFNNTCTKNVKMVQISDIDEQESLMIHCCIFENQHWWHHITDSKTYFPTIQKFVFCKYWSIAVVVIEVLTKYFLNCRRITASAVIWKRTRIASVLRVADCHICYRKLIMQFPCKIIFSHPTCSK
jgi:hypothetical protein